MSCCSSSVIYQIALGEVIAFPIKFPDFNLLLQVDNRNIAVVMEKVVETPESISILQAAIDEVMQNGGLPQKLKVLDWILEAGEGAVLNPIGVAGAA